MNTITYQVGKLYFNSLFNALYESMRTHEFPKFICFDNEFSKYNWSEPIEHTFETLMDIRARQIQNQYKKIILSFSGGYDSATILNVFKRNNVHIDEIIFTYNNKYDKKPMIDWLGTQTHLKDTKITSWYSYEKKILAHYYKNEEWIFTHPGLYRPNIISPSTHSQRYLSDRYGTGNDWVFIAGFEKPMVRFRQGKWYNVFLDKMFYPVLNHRNIDLFYISPELPQLAIKQAQMMKEWAKNNCSFTEGWVSTQDKFENYYSYKSYAFACGRHDELSMADSIGQKLLAKNNCIIINDNKTILYEKGKDDEVIERIDDMKEIQNYMDGWRSILADENFFSFLKKNWFDNPYNLRSIKGIWSTSYCIGT